MPAPLEARTSTFLLTDIEGSTRLWAEHGDAMAHALAAHDDLLRVSVDGTLVKNTGDGILAAFDEPRSAVAAALAGQRALRDHAWPATGPLRVRMAIHSGSAEARDGDFHGPSLNRVARLLAIGHGGQVLLSGPGPALIEDRLPAEAELIDRGEHRLRDIDRPEHVFQLVVPDLPRDFPALRSGTPKTNLPAQLTSFIGREREIGEVARLLREHRLVSLVGVGGTGKTRLMLRVGDDLVDRYADGAWLVELAPITEPGLVAQELARALGIPDVPGQPAIAVVTDFLRSKDLLLLLDNREHLIEAAANVVERLLGSCHGLRVLATSREALSVRGEATFQVPSLGMPAQVDHDGHHGRPDDAWLEEVAASEAIRLFVDRASATTPGFRLDPMTAGPLVEICRRLDGIPLAIELAAARVNVLSVAEIAQRLGDRFRLLTGGRRTAVPRQQTLQALIDWSWDLLAEPDQRLLRRLSVFAGGWTLDAAAEVTRDEGDASDDRLATLDGLGRLVDRSLVVVDRGDSTRYRMLETIRQYARDRLVASGEAPAVRGRHLVLFHRLAREAEARITGPDVAAWLDRLDAEVDNLRAALDWAYETDVEAALEMSAALAQYWRHRSVGAEGMDRLHQAVDALDALPEPESSLRAQRATLAARVLASAAMMAVTTGRETQDAGGWVADAVRLSREGGDRRVLAFALANWAFSGWIDWPNVAWAAAGKAIDEAQRDPAIAAIWLERATDAARRSGDPTAIAFAAFVRGRALGYQGRLDEARPWFLEVVTAARTLGDVRQELVARSELRPCHPTCGIARGGGSRVSRDHPRMAAPRPARRGREPARVIRVSCRGARRPPARSRPPGRGRAAPGDHRGGDAALGADRVRRGCGSGSDWPRSDDAR